jgi:hypothetical protein
VIWSVKERSINRNRNIKKYLTTKETISQRKTTKREKGVREAKRSLSRR